MAGLITVQVVGTDLAIAKMAALAVASEAAAEAGEEAGAEVVLDVASSRVPVLTGALRDSLEIVPDDEGTLVGTEIPYAVFVEYGTGDTPAQPFLRPAADDSTEEVTGSMATALEAGDRVGAVSIDTDVYDTLSLAADNVYPVSLPLQGALYPAVTYRRVSARRIRSHDGTSLIGALYQFTCWHTSPTEARATARDVVAIWEPLMDRAQVENHLETYDPGNKIFGAIVDVRVWAHEEDVAS